MNKLTKIITYIIMLVLPLTGSLIAAEGGKAISSLNGVDLMQIDKYSPDGNHFGSDLFVVNRNTYSVEVSIKLSSSSNIKNGLLSETFVVEPGQTGYFGWLAQDAKESEGTWNVEWYVNKHENVTPAAPTPSMSPKPQIQTTPVTPSTTKPIEK